MPEKPDQARGAREVTFAKKIREANTDTRIRLSPAQGTSPGIRNFVPSAYMFDEKTGKERSEGVA
jgi:hypothetical protein